MATVATIENSERNSFGPTSSPNAIPGFVV
jgi:hypothetical protein